MTVPEDWLPLAGMIKRELVSQLRRKSAGYSFAVLIGIAIGLFWMMTEKTSVRRIGDGTLYFGFALLYVASLLRVTTIAALSLVSERQQRTLEQLQLSHLSHGEIVFAKAVSAFVYFLLVCIGMLPIFGVVFFYVGVEIPLFLCGFGFLVCSTLAHAGVGLLVGVNQTNPTSATLSAVVLACALSAAGAYAAGVCMFLFSPLADLLGRSNQNATAIVYLSAFSVVNLLILWLGIRGATVQLPRPIPLAAPRATAPRPAFPNLSAFKTFHWIKDGENPVTVKEIRGEYFNPSAGHATEFRGWLVLAVLLAFFVSIFVVGNSNHEDGLVISWVYTMVSVVCAIFIPLKTAAGLARERAASTYEMLSLSMLTPREIIGGHVWAAVSQLKLFGAVLLLITPVGAFVQGAGVWANFLHSLFLLTGCIAQVPVLCAIGALAGVLGDTVARAVGVAFLLTALLYTWSAYWMHWGLRVQGGFSALYFFRYLLYEFAFAAVLGWLAVRILARTQTADSRVNRFLNRSLFQKDF